MDEKKLVDREVDLYMELGLVKLQLDERLAPYLEDKYASLFKKRKIEKGKRCKNLKDKL